MRMLVVEKLAAGIRWLFYHYMLSVNSSDTLWKVPLGVKCVGNHVPFSLCGWGLNRIGEKTIEYASL